MIDYRAIGRRIGLYRKRKGLTQADFSELLGVSESYVSQVERGIAKASLHRLDEMACVLDTDVALLISDNVIRPDDSVNSEVSAIIRSWPKDKIDLLISLLSCAQEHFKNA